MARVIGDEVWAALDPSVGRLSRRTAVRMLVVGAVAVLLAVAVSLLWQSGLVVAQVAWPGTSGYAFEAGPGNPVRHEVTVGNDGWTPVTLLGAGRDLPGMRLIAVEAIFPVTVPPGDSVSFWLTYEVTDCAALRNDTSPIPVRVQRWWGEQTAYIDVPEQTLNAPAFYSYTGENPYAAQWHFYLGEVACGRA